jgi:hypothetical protein
MGFCGTFRADGVDADKVSPNLELQQTGVEVLLGEGES